MRCASRAAHPEALYFILGQTHPVVRRHEGEIYRESLEKLVAEYGLAATSADRPVSRLRRTGAVPAGNRHLPHAVSESGADRERHARVRRRLGKAVMSTPYLYAEELLAHGRGFLVDFRDAASIAKRCTSLLDDPELRQRPNGALIASGGR